jgi:hypothetical protein
MSSKISSLLFLILFVGFFAFSGSSKMDSDKYSFTINPGDTLGLEISNNYLIISKLNANNSSQCIENVIIKNTMADSSMGLPCPPIQMMLSRTWPPETTFVAMSTCINCK